MTRPEVIHLFRAISPIPRRLAINYARMVRGFVAMLRGAVDETEAINRIGSEQLLEPDRRRQVAALWRKLAQVLNATPEPRSQRPLWAEREHPGDAEISAICDELVKGGLAAYRSELLMWMFLRVETGFSTIGEAAAAVGVSEAVWMSWAGAEVDLLLDSTHERLPVEPTSVEPGHAYTLSPCALLNRQHIVTGDARQLRRAFDVAAIRAVVREQHGDIVEPSSARVPDARLERFSITTHPPHAM